MKKVCILKVLIIEWFKENSCRYDNIRLLKTKLENAIYDELTEKFVFDE